MAVPAIPYCNVTTDLQRVFHRIEDYAARSVVKTWTNTSGSVYEHQHTGYVGGVWEDGSALVIKTSIAEVEATVSTFWYDPATDILYVQMAGSGDPDAITGLGIEVAGYDTWFNYKTQASYDAMSELEGMLDPKFPNPLPQARNPYAIAGITRNYDWDIVQCAAILTVKNIIQGINPADSMIPVLMAKLINEEGNGIIDEHRDGKRAFSFEMTGDEHMPSVEPLSVAGSGRVIAYGEYTGEKRDTWLLTITTGGAIDESTTPKYKISFDNGNTDHVTDQQAYYEQRLIKDGVSLAFDDREGNFTGTDTYLIHVEPYDLAPTNASLRSARIRR